MHLQTTIYLSQSLSGLMFASHQFCFLGHLFWTARHICVDLGSAPSHSVPSWCSVQDWVMCLRLFQRLLPPWAVGEKEIRYVLIYIPSTARNTIKCKNHLQQQRGLQMFHFAEKQAWIKMHDFTNDGILNGGRHLESSLKAVPITISLV